MSIKPDWMDIKQRIYCPPDWLDIKQRFYCVPILFLLLRGRGTLYLGYPLFYFGWSLNILYDWFDIKQVFNDFCEVSLRMKGALNLDVLFCWVLCCAIHNIGSTVSAQKVSAQTVSSHKVSKIDNIGQNVSIRIGV